MAKSVTFRMEEDKIQAIDHLAESMDRDRSYLINEAIDQFLEVKRWHAEQIELAIAEADAGRFASAEEVRTAFDAFKPKA